MSAPIPFDGPPEQARANYRSHSWISHFGETVCMECESKPWHASAHYPCGASVPRSDDPALVDASILRFAGYSMLRSLDEEEGTFDE